MRRKVICGMMATLLSISLLVGCGTVDKEEKLEVKITTTIFPVYDWLSNIVGDEAEVEMLLDNSIDLHNYEPTAEDIIEIAKSDVFIYIGGHSDDWVEDVIETSTNKDLITINLIELLGDKAKVEEEIDGMEAHEHNHGDEHDHKDEDSHSEEEHNEEGHNHDEEDHNDEEGHNHDEEEHSDEEGHSHENAIDEHIWLSLKNASFLVDEIATILSDEYNNEAYKENAQKYIDKIIEVDKSYEEAIENSERKTLIFGDRFPFRYLVDDYGIEYYAAFAGCSAESEASFETIIFLANKVDELDIDYIMELQNSKHEIAKTIADNTNDNKEILTLNSLESNTSKDLEKGVTYISVMKENLEVIKKAFK